MLHTHRLVLAGALLALASPAAAQRWYRGNTHVHTTNSDGNGTPGDVARWYREHGYDFLVVTDHERITDVAPLGAPTFLVIAGQEITQQLADARADGARQAHVNALGATRVIQPLGDKGVATHTTIAATYARNVGEVRASGAVAQVNHPNFRWSVSLADMTALPDSTLFEVWNAQPEINNLGGDDGDGQRSLATEALWDSLLTRGRRLFAVGSDDAHKFRPEQLEDFGATRPGGAWVMVRADTLSAASILSSLRTGRFYATNGPLLDDVVATSSELRIRIAPLPGRRDDRRYVTRFVGRGGRTLAEVPGREARYLFRGNEGYVRATITDSNGRRAWVQPVWPTRSKATP